VEFGLGVFRQLIDTAADCEYLGIIDPEGINLSGMAHAR